MSKPLIFTSRENPVMAEFREEATALGHMYPQDYVRVCSRAYWGSEASKEHLRHARVILTRLVNAGRQGAPFPNHTDGSRPPADQ